MQVFTSSANAATSLAAQRSRTALAIGSFDGLHRAHMALLDRAINLASNPPCGESTDDRNLLSALLTFDPHPARFFRPQQHPALITNAKQKEKVIESRGIDALIVEPFDEILAGLDPERFIKTILVDRLRVAYVIIGDDFSFGEARKGTPRTLTDRGKYFGFETEIVAPIRLHGRIISSTLIRKAIAEGDVEQASELLGRPYALTGVVVSGAGRGRTIGVPTANLKSDNEILPARGVYSARIYIGSAPHLGVVNIGRAPTFGGESEDRIEAHLLDFSGDLLGQSLEIQFVHRIRDEMHFPSAEKLVERIRGDIQEARKRLTL